MYLTSLTVVQAPTPGCHKCARRNATAKDAEAASLTNPAANRDDIEAPPPIDLRSLFTCNLDLTER